ncbi:Golgi SNAP receptor complex member 1 [Merluccius polli]|uniref:Golgi SNAP receptor complex member 1 n=1 Tax=Merluccius polli TaxID=89951 RepID=A0AA47P3C2_MERPO|nr:Golgi SNAP receptor complex member 1 [Merluccius polli]
MPADLRKHARQLENELDLKLVSFSKLCTSYTSSRDGRRGDSSDTTPLLNNSSQDRMFDTMSVEIEQLLAKLTGVNDKMAEYTSTPGAASLNAALMHTLQRHRDILQDYTNEFHKTKGNFLAIREREDLLGSVRKDIETYKSGSGVNNRRTELFLKEHEHLRKRNVLETMEDCELIKRYRLNREGIKLVVELVRDAITSPTNRNNSISPEIKCLATLQYLATGTMQLCNADDLAVSQLSFIRFPLDNQQLHRIKANFMAIAGMPGVVGAIDGTHIQIIAPSKDEDVFVNRKKVHSVNTQIAFDATFNIIDVVAKWPGSTHDSRILMGSGLRLGCHLLGDSSYPCKTWLLTPNLNPQPGAQLKYNISDRLMDDTISIAMATKENMTSQRGFLKSIQGKVNTLANRFPAINNLIQRVNLRKRRDSLILGGVIGVCTILLLLYAFH